PPSAWRRSLYFPDICGRLSNGTLMRARSSFRATLRTGSFHVLDIVYIFIGLAVFGVFAAYVHGLRGI
ncbi:MAG TPA: hypothetical protein VK634_02770, partial [Reyranella sp.]|nr:hypothetical protein [Reyranella sp.]